MLDAINSAQLGAKETIVGRISVSMYDKYQQMNISGKCFASAEKKRELNKKLSDVNIYAVMYHTGEWFKNLVV